MESSPAGTIDMRAPGDVMQLARMGSFHPMRLSFMRILLRRAKAEGWQVDRTAWQVDDAGVGHAVYRARTPSRTYSLVAFAHDLPADQRSDRVIAEAWDATFALFDGEPTADDITRLAANVPLQEAGRVSASELSLSRANRSVRLFEHVVDALSQGRQPDQQAIEDVGYLMRTTAVYGSGKFGLSDHEAIAGRPELGPPFQAEMLSVWLIRVFSIDIVEHMAAVRGGAQAVRMAPDIRRTLGIGNATGLGMAPFLINHPVLINNWIAAREEALSRVRALAHAGAAEWEVFSAMVARACRHVDTWKSEHPIQIRKLRELTEDMAKMCAHLEHFDPRPPMPWDRLWRWGAEALGLEGQEMLVALLLEPHGALIDDLANTMSADESVAMQLDGRMSIGEVRNRLEHDYAWALGTDWQTPAATARIWYVSEEKLEPRLGERAADDLDAYEQPLAPGRDAARLCRDLKDWPDDDLLAAFLIRHPQHRTAIRRLQLLDRFPYAEVRDNTIDAEMLPIDLLRAKLSFFGATRFDPKSDRWVRITMYRGAPFPDELHAMPADDWMFPA